MWPFMLMLAISGLARLIDQDTAGLVLIDQDTAGLVLIDQDTAGLVLIDQDTAGLVLIWGSCVLIGRVFKSLHEWWG